MFCRLIFLCQQNSRGIGEEVILADMPSLKGQPLADAINRLMKKVKKYTGNPNVACKFALTHLVMHLVLMFFLYILIFLYS